MPQTPRPADTVTITFQYRPGDVVSWTKMPGVPYRIQTRQWSEERGGGTVIEYEVWGPPTSGIRWAQEADLAPWHTPASS